MPDVSQHRRHLPAGDMSWFWLTWADGRGRCQPPDFSSGSLERLPPPNFMARLASA